MSDRMERFEIKYCVPDPVAAAILSVARVFLVPERGLAVGQAQTITSLYLDTRELTFMRWHIEDEPERFKLRVRAYGAAPWPTMFGEIKEKQSGLSRKRRAEVPANRLDELLNGSHLAFANGLPPPAAVTLEEFAWRRLTLRASPIVLLRASRESMRGGFGDTSAVTVDRDIVWQPASWRTFDADPSAWRPLPLPPTGSAIVEIKHGPRRPRWVAGLMGELAGWRVAFSKYVAAASQLQSWEVASCLP